MSFEKELLLKVKTVEDRIYRFLPVEGGLHDRVASAMNYSFMGGGKRLRPMLIMEIGEALGAKKELLDPFMAALEMIHTYSLIHDDLPAMDNDDYRRGRKTCHIEYGEAFAILAGDGLLNLAMETALTAFDFADSQKERLCVIKALRVLFDRSGLLGMIGGQTIDVENEGKQISEDVLLTIYNEKTGALIEAAMGIGAILSGAEDTLVSELMEAAREIGVAFQIQDDILDVTSTFEKLGKPINSDEKNHKVTYVTLHGLSDSEKKVRQLTDSALCRIRPVTDMNSFLKELICWLVDRDR